MPDTIHTIRTNQAQYDNVRDGQRFIAVWNSEEYNVGERIVIRVPGDDYDCGISSRQFLITHVCTHADWPQGVAGPQKIIGFTEAPDNELQASGPVLTCEKPTGYQPVMVSSMPCGIHPVSVDPYTRTLMACDCSSGYGCERCMTIDQLIENMTQFILNDQIMLESMPSRECMNNLKKYRMELIARPSAKSSIYYTGKDSEE